MQSSHRRKRGPRGFTLIEVLLVLAILVILGSMATIMITTAQQRANIDSTKSQVGMLAGAVDLYQVTMNEYPTSQSGLLALRQPPADARQPDRWTAPFLDRDLPKDAWGNEFRYTYPGSRNPDKFDIWSVGPDGQDGTDDDIGNWSTT